MICSVSSCGRHLPRVYKTQGYCSYHYRIKNEGLDPENYEIRNKSRNGDPLLSILAACKSKSDFCIIWKHGKDDHGYGAITYDGKRYKAHRLALMFYSGEHPDRDTFCCHKCDIPSCINPKHLYWGDATTNALDRSIYTARA